MGQGNFITIDYYNQNCVDNENKRCINSDVCLYIQGVPPLSFIAYQQSGDFNPKFYYGAVSNYQNYEIGCRDQNGNIVNQQCSQKLYNGITVRAYGNYGFTGYSEQDDVLYFNGFPAYEPILIRTGQSECMVGGYNQFEQKFMYKKVTIQDGVNQLFGCHYHGQNQGLYVNNNSQYTNTDDRLGIMKYTYNQNGIVGECDKELCIGVKEDEEKFILVIYKGGKLYNGYIKSIGCILDGEFHQDNICKVRGQGQCYKGNEPQTTIFCVDLEFVFQNKKQYIIPSQHYFRPSSVTISYVFLNNKKNNIYDGLIYSLTTEDQSCPNRLMLGTIAAAPTDVTTAVTTEQNNTFSYYFNDGKLCGSPGTVISGDMVLQVYDYVSATADTNYYGVSRLATINCVSNTACATGGTAISTQRYGIFQSVNGQYQGIIVGQLATGGTQAAGAEIYIQTIKGDNDLMFTSLGSAPYAALGGNSATTGTYFYVANECISVSGQQMPFQNGYNSDQIGCIQYGSTADVHTVQGNSQKVLTPYRGYFFNLYGYDFISILQRDGNLQNRYHFNVTSLYTAGSTTIYTFTSTSLNRGTAAMSGTLIDSQQNQINDTFAVGSNGFFQGQNNTQLIMCLTKTRNPDSTVTAQTGSVYSYIIGEKCFQYMQGKRILLQNQVAEGSLGQAASSTASLANSKLNGRIITSSMESLQSTNYLRGEFLSAVPFTGYHDGQCYKNGRIANDNFVCLDNNGNCITNAEKDISKVQQNCIEFDQINQNAISSGVNLRQYKFKCVDCIQGQNIVFNQMYFDKSQKGSFIRQYMIPVQQKLNTVQQGVQANTYTLTATTDQQFQQIGFGLSQNKDSILQYNIINIAGASGAGYLEPTQNSQYSLGLQNSLAFGALDIDNLNTCVNQNNKPQTYCPYIYLQVGDTTQVIRFQLFQYNLQENKYTLNPTQYIQDFYQSLQLKQDLGIKSIQQPVENYVMRIKNQLPHTGFDNGQCYLLGMYQDNCYRGQDQCYGLYVENGTFYRRGQRFNGYVNMGRYGEVDLYRIFLGYFANGILADENGKYFSKGKLAGQNEVELIDGKYYQNGYLYDTVKLYKGCPLAKDQLNFYDGELADGDFICCPNNVEKDCHLLRYSSGKLANGYHDGLYYTQGKLFTGCIDAPGGDMCFINGIPSQGSVKYQRDIWISLLFVAIFIGLIFLYTCMGLNYQKSHDKQKDKILVNRMNKGKDPNRLSKGNKPGSQRVSQGGRIVP